MGIESGRVRFDAEAYARQSQNGPCFVCSMLAGHPDYGHHAVYEDGAAIACLARWPTLLGYGLVAPKRHAESWTDDLSEPEFLALQRVTRRVARAVAAVLPVERMYCLTLGSQQVMRTCTGTSRRFRPECRITSSSTAR